MIIGQNNNYFLNKQQAPSFGLSPELLRKAHSKAIDVADTKDIKDPTIHTFIMKKLRQSARFILKAKDIELNNFVLPEKNRI